MADEVRAVVQDEADIIYVRGEGRRLAAQAGFSSSQQVLIATAISEVARNIVQYAGKGQIIVRIIEESGDRGLLVVAHDEGPGIADVEQALRDGYSTSGGLGLGLPGAKRIMDEFDILSVVGKGTTITMKKWLSQGRRVVAAFH